MKKVALLLPIAMVFAAVQSFAANTHTVTFRRMNGTVLQSFEVQHGANATSLAPALPAETDMTPQRWDHADWLASVTNDVTCWALYEATTAKSPSTSIASQPIADRETPYSLDEYFQLYNNLAWSDEFSGSTLSVGGSGKNWQYDTGVHNNELETYTQGPNQQVSDGVLRLICTRESSTKVTSTKINSKGRVAFKLGRCEIRAKVTKQEGAFPAFWMMGTGENAQWPWCTEIDIMEQVNGGDWITGTLHMPKYARSTGNNEYFTNRAVTSPEDGVHWGDGYHRFGIVVNERELVWYVDDHIFLRMDIRDSRYDILRNYSQYILLNFAFGGNWSGHTSHSDSAITGFQSEDFVIDYCRIFTNTKANNTVTRGAEPDGARLSGPVKATVWRGWQMNWGKQGADYFQNHLLNNKQTTHVRNALREYTGRDAADAVVFLTRTKDLEDNVNSFRVCAFDVPGYSFLFTCPRPNALDDAEGDVRERLLGGVMFNKRRFSSSDSAINAVPLGSSTSFSNCCAVVAELVEKDTGAKVKVVGVNVISTNGVATAGSVAAQGFDALMSKLDAIKEEKVILLLQGMGQNGLKYIDGRVNSELAHSYAKLGQHTQGWPAYQYQSAWVTSNYMASAERPVPLSVPKSNGQAAGVHTNQAYCATVQFEAPESNPGVVYGPLATNLYAKSMKVLFAGVQQGVTLTNFPVLVKLSTAIDGFSYGDFARPNGGDLRFADSTGKLLPHEIDTWNSNGVSTVWVKVPSLTKDAAITAHYGYTGAGDPEEVDPKDVWDSNYVGVWHLGESALPMAESTGVSTPFASKTGTASYGAAGAVGGSVDFTAAKGTESFLTAADDDDLDGFDDFTVEMWTCQDTFYNANEAYAGTLVKRNARADNESWFTYQDKATLMPGLAYGNDAAASDRTLALANTRPAIGEWTHQAFVRTVSTSNVVVFMDGTNNSTTVKSSGAVFAGSAPLMLGGGGGQKSFPGQIDEVRISKVARSAAWIKATHDTIANADFVTYAVEGAEPIPDADINDLKLKARTDKENPIDYVEGEAISFEFRLDGVPALPQAVQAKAPLYVIWKRTGDDGATAWGTNAISLAQRFSVETRLAIPGIVRLQGTLVGSDYQPIEYTDSSNTKKNITFGGGAGVATERMQLSTVEPADFNQFWEEAKAKLAAVPMAGAELVEVFPNATQTNKYHFFAAKIPCFGPRPVTGWLIYPKNAAPGSLSVKAKFDGYSVAIAQPSVPYWEATAGTMLFHVNAHGYDMVGQNAQYYKDFIQTVNSPYYTPSHGKPYSHGLGVPDYDNPTNTYFYFMALRAARAFDYLKSRSEWNGRDVIAEGGSQGGLQTMWAGSLVDGISKIRPYITWGCDIGNSLNATGPFLSNEWGIPNVPGAYYFDGALHAKRVPRTCVAEITRVGLSDYTSPPRGVLLSYYNMKCPVSAKLVQGSDHSKTSVPPGTNQVYVISKAAEPEPVVPSASDAAGFDYTNRVVMVTNATAGARLTLTATASDGTTVSATAAVGDNGEATFDIATVPGEAYDYTIVQDGDTIAAGGFFTGGWDSGGSLFSAAPDGTGGSVELNGGWTEAPSGTNAAHYVVVGGADFGLSADAAVATGGNLVRVDAAVQYDFIDDAGSFPNSMLDGLVGGMVAATSGGAAKWMVGAASGWKELVGGPVPQADTPYVLRMEADFKSDPPKVRCSVSDDDGANFTVLFDADGNAWHAVSKTALGGVVFDGDGCVASIGGTLANADVAEADGVGYASLADAIAASTNTLRLLTNATWPTNTPVGTIAVNRGGYALQGVTLDGNGKAVVQSGYSAIPGEGRVNITLAQAAALGVATADKSPSQIAAALAANGANGIPLWKSYVLGLDSADATAQPKATIAMNGENVVLALVGINVQEGTGATVSYKVYKFSDLANMAAAEAVGADRAVDAPAQVPKDASGPKMFYRLKVDVRGY